MAASETYLPDASGPPPGRVGDVSSKSPFKRVMQAVSLVIAFPFAALAFFGRFPILYTIGAHSFAQIPGIAGDYLRIAFYRLTLKECSLDSRISFGSFFARRLHRLVLHSRQIQHRAANANRLGCADSQR
jgi:hypothetical protein